MKSYRLWLFVIWIMPRLLCGMTVDVEGYQVSGGEVWSNGTVRNESTTVAVGKNSSGLSAGVMYFELPDLNGAAITSARFQFHVNSVTNQTSLHNTNMNLVAIRSGTALGTRFAADYTGIGSSGTTVQSNIALWNDTFPKDYQTSAAADNTLADWLADQYAAVGVGGVVYLRLEPTQDTGAVTNFIVQSGSAQLIITSDGNVTPTSGSGTTVSAKVGNAPFSWTFDRAVQWGQFIDGQPWVVMPSGGILNLTAATPSRLNSQAVYVRNDTGVSPFTADINITVKNPPFDHYFSGTGWTDNPSGVFGWDSRAGHMGSTTSPTYNAALGWDGTTPLPLAVGDSITTPQSMTTSAMPSRATMLNAVGVLTVLGSVPAADAFRPGVIRSGTDRTNPEILTYSSLINLNPYLISSPVGTTDLTGTNVVSIIPMQYRFYELKSNLNGPWFMNTGYCLSEGVNPLLNNTTLPVTTTAVVYGGNMGEYMGYTAIGCLASWLTADEQKSCRIRYIQRAIDVYSAMQAGVCLEEGAGIMPGYSTLLTNAGVMMNHAGMKSVNNGLNGVKPYWMFADFATMWHTDGVPSTDLSSGETTDRLIPLYSSGTNNYPEYNKAGIQPIAASSGTTMTMATTFQWGNADRPINDIINMKVRITSGAGASSTIYTIINAITSVTLPDAEKFRTTGGVLYDGSSNTSNYVMGGKVQVEPAWTNGLPDSTSTLTMSIFANDPSNPVTSGSAKWFYNMHGRVLPANPATLDKVKAVNCSPNGEYTSVQTGGTIDNLIVLYALGQQSLYKGGLDKYMIQVGQIAGYGEWLFQGSYLSAIGGYGTGVGNPRGAMWKQKVLTPLGIPFVYTSGATTSLPVVNPSAKLWNESDGPPVIIGSLSATGTNGSGFSYQIIATNSPTSFDAVNLPSGLSVNTATGLISGIPTLTGTYSSTIYAINAFGSGSATLSLSIVNPPSSPPVITSAATATGTNGLGFSYQIIATNSPTSFDAVNLPSGLSVNTATGLISGIPTLTGTFTSTIYAINAFGSGSATLSLSIVNPPALPPVITSAATATGTNGLGFSYQITASNNPTSFNATNLPSELSVNTATGLISGTPTLTGTYSPTIYATNSLGSGTATLSLSIVNPSSSSPVITSGTVTGGVVGYPFAYNITATNSPTGFSATGLPAGFTINTATGVISGTPTITGTFIATIGAVNGFGTGNTTLALQVFSPYFWSNFAGSPGLTGTANGTGTNARFNSGAVGLTLDNSGNIYVADSMNHTIRKITPTGVVTTLAGTPLVSGTADGGPGTNARFNTPRGIAADASGNVYVADSSNNTIRKVTPAGVVTTLAGMPRVSGIADGTGTTARFNVPRGLALDDGGNLYIADTSNNTVRKMTPGNVVTTLAGNNNLGPGSTDGTGIAARFNAPRGLVVDSGSNIYVADYGNHTIRMITPASVVTTIAGAATVSGTQDGIGGNARFNNPNGIAMDADGNLYVSDSANNTIRKMTLSGSSWMVTTIGGSPGVTGTSDGAGIAARFNTPFGVGVDSGGFAYVLDGSNSRISKGYLFEPPVISSSSMATGLGYLPFSFSITASDNPFSYSATGLPPGLTIDTTTGVISGTATSTGTFSSTIYATNAAGQTSVTLTFVIQASYAGWQNQWSVSGSASAMSADGIPNLLRYALNLNSQTSGAAGLPKVQTVSSNGNSYLTLSYTQVMAATDIVYTVEVSGDLHTWNSGGGYTSIINATNNADGVTQTVTVQDLTPINIATQRFLRLKVTKP